MENSKRCQASSHSHHLDLIFFQRDISDLTATPQASVTSMLRTISRTSRLPQRLHSSQSIVRIRPNIKIARMTSTLPQVTPPISTRLPADSFQLLPENEKPGSEDDLFSAQVEEVEKWWSSDRYTGIKRSYSAADVVDKRGSLQQTYPSSLMARKLWNLLNDKSKKGEPVHTCRSYSSFSHSRQV